VRFQDRTFRFIGTDFDAVNAEVRRRQGAELRAGPAQTSLPVVVAMDSNSQAAPLPQDATYLDFLAGGYNDAWAKLNPHDDGFTCCQNEYVNNQDSELFTRIDLVLSLGNIDARQIELFGESASDKTPDGLWPSDHAGIAAQLLVH
jgi:exonuclease III